jgi:hypothetical protein
MHSVAAALAGAMSALPPVIALPSERADSMQSHPILPVPAAAQAAAWEIEDAPFERAALPSFAMAPEGDPEFTDLVPRTRRNIGVGIAVGALVAAAACFLLLRPPAARPLPAPARITAPAMAMPALATESAVIPVPSTPITPSPEPAIVAPPAVVAPIAPVAPTTP